MEQHKEKKGCGKALLLLFVLVSIFLIIGGTMIALVDDSVGGIVCAGIGVFVLLLFVGIAFHEKHPESKFGAYCLAGLGVLIAAGACIFIFSAMFMGMFVEPFRDMEHYLKVYETPVTVTATVTNYDSYDDDGSTVYESFVTYTYQQTRYKDFLYERKHNREDLTPLGNEVTIQISPLDPRTQISKLAQNNGGVHFSSAIVCLALSGLYMFLQQLHLSKGLRGTPDRDTVQKDLKIKIRSRILRPFLLLCWISYGLLFLRYSVVLEATPLILAIVSFCGWLYCMAQTIRDYRNVEMDDFRLQRDVLVDKSEDTDSEGSTTYSLKYQGDSGAWSRNVPYKDYNLACVGDAVLAAYLPGKKKPTLHYTRDGIAH